MVGGSSQCAENSLIAPYRKLPGITALQGRRNSAGGQAALGRPARLCCSVAPVPVFLVNTGHHQTSQSYPPHMRPALLREIDSSNAPYYSGCIDKFYLSLWAPPSLLFFRSQPLPTAKPPARGTRRFHFCATLLSRPQPPTASLAQYLAIHDKTSCMVYDGHR